MKKQQKQKEQQRVGTIDTFNAIQNVWMFSFSPKCEQRFKWMQLFAFLQQRSTTIFALYLFARSTYLCRFRLYTPFVWRKCIHSTHSYTFRDIFIIRCSETARGRAYLCASQTLTHTHTPSLLVIVEYIKAKWNWLRGALSKNNPELYRILIRFGCWMRTLRCKTKIRIYLFVFVFVLCTHCTVPSSICLFHSLECLLHKLLNLCFYYYCFFRDPCFFSTA